MYEVYLITNKVNNMKYVGITCQGAEKRYRGHLGSADGNTSQAPLHIAIREFGKSNFSMQVLESNISQEEARDREKYFIELYDTLEPHGYNTYRAGMGGRRHSDEARQHISDRLKGHKFSASRNEKVRKAMIAREYKQAWSDNLSKAMLGKCAGEKNPFYGKKHTPEVLAKIQSTKLLHPDHTIEYLSTAGEVLHEFPNFAIAGRWVVRQGLANTSAVSCAERISRNVRAESTRVIYNGIWRFKERSID